MTAYIVFIRESTQDAAELERYSASVKPSFDGHPVSFLALYGKHETLEGAPVEGVVIISFPTMDAAKTWYDSPAYQEVAQHRFKGATYRVVVVEGV
jgi:uncharacterized protein (DUF1330 family)